MKKSKFSEEQIIGILRGAEGDTPVKAVCARHNVSEPTFYKLHSKYGGMEVNEESGQ
jgi:putative transposase